MKRKTARNICTGLAVLSTIAIMEISGIPRVSQEAFKKEAEYIGHRPYMVKSEAVLGRLTATLGPAFIAGVFAYYLFPKKINQ